MRCSSGRLVWLLAWVLFPVWVVAQAHGGTLTGRVTRPGGVPVTPAEVTATADSGRLYSARANKEGRYVLSGLPPGRYLVAAEADGARAVVSRVWVRGGGRQQLDLVVTEGAATRRPAPVYEASTPVHGSSYGDLERDELPLPRNLWRVLENLEPSVVADRFDVGGIWTGRPALLGTHGSSFTQTSYFFEGVDITDPLEPGKPLLYADYDALDELRVSTAAHDLPVRAPGAAISFTTHEPGAAWRGRLYFSFQGQGLQGDNRSDRQRALGYERPWEFQNFSEFNARGGGPLGRDWSLFFSAGTEQLSFRIPGFDATPSSRVFSALLRFDYDPSERHHVGLFWTGQNLRSRHVDGFPGGTELVTTRDRDTHQVALARWDFRASPRTVLDAHFLWSRTTLSDLAPKEATGSHRRQLFQVAQQRNVPAGNVPLPTACEGVLCGNNSAPLLADSPRTRVRLGAGLTRELPAAGGITQQLLLHGYWSGGWTTNTLFTARDTHLLFFPGETPFGVVQWNTPVNPEQRLHEVVLGGEHRINIKGRLYVRWGLLVDHSSVALPAQGSPGGRFRPARSFPGRDAVIDWMNVSPRVGFTLRVGPWDTLLRGSFARYYHTLGARLADFANGNALSGRYFTWNDWNGDFDFQPGEEGTLLRRFGGEFSRIDADLDRPHTDEFTLGVEQPVGRQFIAGVRFFRRDARDLLETINEGVPFSAFTPVSFPDPGEDGLPGTFDDQTLVVWNQDPATLGRDSFLLTNPGLRTAYKGVEITAERPYRGRWMLRASFTAGETRGPTAPGNSVFLNDAVALGGLFSADMGAPGNDGFATQPHLFGTLFDNPNTLLNANGRLFFDRAFTGKLSGYARGPWAIAVSSVVKYFDGLPFARRVVVTGLNQGPFFVLADPRGDLRTEFNLSWDVRFARDFTVRGRPLNLFVDIFNLLNLNNRTVENSLATTPGLAFRDPVKVQPPLVLRLGFSYHFGGRRPALE